MNADATPIVFIHGLWLHASSWDNWVTYFREEGYSPVAPGWPQDSATAKECRLYPARMNGIGVNDVVSHYARIIEKIPTKPIVIGHSFGGLIAQKLLGQGLACAAVAIDPAPIKGVFVLPPSALRSAFPVLKNPFNVGRAIALSSAQFHYSFTNTLPPDESIELFEKYAIPTPGKPLFEAAFANLNPGSSTKIDMSSPSRGPLLLIAGLEDNTVPAAIVRSTLKQYRNSKAVTAVELKEFDGRGHSLAMDHGWKEVTDYSLAWLKKQGM